MLDKVAEPRWEDLGSGFVLPSPSLLILPNCYSLLAGCWDWQTRELQFRHLYTHRRHESNGNTGLSCFLTAILLGQNDCRTYNFSYNKKIASVFLKSIQGQKYTIIYSNLNQYNWKFKKYWTCQGQSFSTS